MAKFYGKVGYVLTEEISPGVWGERSIVRRCAGDILTSSRRYENGTSINDNLVLSSRLSLIADSFMTSNLAQIKWVELWDTKWKVTNIEVLYPRVILSMGGVWSAEDETGDPD